MKMKRMSMILIGLVLCAAIIIGLAAGQMPAAKADGEKTIVGLGTTEIANPADGAGGWSQVYFGSKTTPILFNVLKNGETNFGGKTMLLDCASILEIKKFDNDGEPNQTGHKANEWAISDIRTWLNGEFLGAWFTTAEQFAIAASIKSGKGDGDGGDSNFNWVPLGGEKVFLLDVAEAFNNSYGFESNNIYVTNNTRVKKLNNSEKWWWLRSSYISDTLPYVGAVAEDGVRGITSPKRDTPGVSPALNVKLSSVIFSSLISGTAGQPGAIYKLTIADTENRTVGIQSEKEAIRDSATTVTVPYQIDSGSNHVSLLITNKDDTWSAESGWSDGAKMYHYTTAAVSETTGTVKFTLPFEYETYKESWKVWLLAEQVNDGNVTDYASAPLEITVPVVFYPLWVGETQVTSDNCNDLETNHWSYSAETNTLTLDNFSYKGAGYTYSTGKKAIIYYAGEDDFTIDFSGKNCITPTSYNGIVSSNAGTALILSGTGSLIIDGTGYGVDNYLNAIDTSGPVIFRKGTFEIGDRINAYRGVVTTGIVTIEAGITSLDAYGYAGGITGKVVNAIVGVGYYNTGADASSAKADTIDGHNSAAYLAYSIPLFGDPNYYREVAFPREQYTLAFDPNGGKGTMESKTVTEGETIPLPECLFDPPENTKQFGWWEVTGVDLIGTTGTGLLIARNCVQGDTITAKAKWEDRIDPFFLVEPEGNDMTYTGTPQALISTGVAFRGKMLYALSDSSTDVPGKEDWAEDIPEQTDAGVYTVWYMAEATTDGAKDTEPEYTEAEIKKATLTVTAKPKSIFYGDTPSNDGIEKITGFVNNETEKVVSGTPDYDYSYARNDPVGNYTITPKGLAAKNYQFTYVPGTLTVQPKSITGATVTLDKTQLTYNGLEQAVAVTGVTVDGLTLTADDYDVTGNKGTVMGEYTVTVTGKGNFKDTATAAWIIVEKAMTVSAENVTAVYDGQPHGIAVTVTDPESGATVNYGKTEDTYDLDASPTITETGILTVYYKITAANYTDYTGKATVTISEAPKKQVSHTVTFKVVNGSWDDGNAADITVTLEGLEGDVLKLPADKIPAVGKKPAETYKAGGWDKTPNADTEITADTTYTYTYAEKDPISATVTLKVVHGAWKDGTKADKTITLTGFEGDELRIPLSEMPGVTEPDEGYEFGTGTWSPSDPPIEYNGGVSGDPITEDTTFTYTYGEITTQLYAVTLKVVHGEWGDELGGRDDRTIFVEGPIGEELRLQFEQIPDVDKPDEGYTADTGAWDKEPPFILDGETYGDPITGDAVYTYTYGVEPEPEPEPEPEDPVMTSIKNFVKRMYEALLGRKADESGLSSWSDLLKSGEASAAQIIRGFACSEEFILKYQTNGAIVRALYIAMLGREPDPEGLDAWANVLAENSPIETVINGLAGSAEFGAICNEYGILPGAVSVPAMTPDSLKRNKIEAFVKRCYFVILGRFPDEEGLKGWSDALQDHSAHAARIIEGFVCSEEFTNMKLSHEATVKVLYRAMLDRTADAEGLRDWTKALDDGYSLQHIINGFCGSVEFTRLCAEYGITPGRLAVAGTMVKREGITPEGEEAAAVIVVQSEYTNEEKVRAFVEHCYQAVFGREGDAEGVENYTALIMDGKKTPKSVAREFIFSSEFQEKLPGNEEFIRILYRLYFDREPGADELAGWVKMLEDGASLEEIVNGFAGSEEFKAIVNGMKE